MENECLCKCCMCGAILIDQNPQVGAIRVPLKGDEECMVLIEHEDDKFWGCPNCRTDEYLMDLPIIFDI